MIKEVVMQKEEVCRWCRRRQCKTCKVYLYVRGKSVVVEGETGKILEVRDGSA